MNDKEENAAKAPTASRLTRRGFRFEALVMVAFWLTMAVWVLGVCHQFGYTSDPGESPVVLGMPAWVVLGVFAPWCFSTLFTIWFALFKMSDDEPDAEEPAADLS